MNSQETVVPTFKEATPQFFQQFFKLVARAPGGIHRIADTEVLTLNNLPKELQEELECFFFKTVTGTWLFAFSKTDKQKPCLLFDSKDVNKVLLNDIMSVINIVVSDWKAGAKPVAIPYKYNHKLYEWFKVWYYNLKPVEWRSK